VAALDTNMPYQNIVLYQCKTHCLLINTGRAARRIVIITGRAARRIVIFPIITGWAVWGIIIWEVVVLDLKRLGPLPPIWQVIL